MAAEQYSNGAQSTLNAGIDDNDLSLVVDSATGFPASGDFRILIGTEILLVTGVSGTTFTVTRGAEGSVAAAHSGGAVVTQIITKGSLEALPAKFRTRSTFAGRDAAALPGKLHLPTDGVSMARDTGSLWVPRGLIWPLTPVDDGDFAWVNQGSATISTDKGISHLSAPATAGEQPRIRVMSAPATPYVATALVQVFSRIVSYAHAGLLFRNSGDNKLHAFSIGHDATGEIVRMASHKYTNTTTWSAYYNEIRWPHRGPLWLRIADNGTNRICSYSLDGVNFLVFHSVGRTDHLTADQIGFYANSNNGSYPIGITLYSWKVE